MKALWLIGAGRGELWESRVGQAVGKGLGQLREAVVF